MDEGVISSKDCLKLHFSYSTLAVFLLLGSFEPSFGSKLSLSPGPVRCDFTLLLNLFLFVFISAGRVP